MVRRSKRDRSTEGLRQRVGLEVPPFLAVRIVLRPVYHRGAVTHGKDRKEGLTEPHSLPVERLSIVAACKGQEAGERLAKVYLALVGIAGATTVAMPDEFLDLREA
jgi:hypothetical protein